MRNPSSNVMPFDQNAEFFARRALKKRQGGHYREAVSLLLRAVQAEPDQTERLMELAEVYGEMGCPLESNRILADLLARPNPDPASWFGLACNLYAMGNTAGAQTAALRYMDAAPEGDYCEEASQLISALQYAEHMTEPAERRLLRCHRLNGRAAALINADQPKSALPLLEKSLTISDVPATQSLYAFALSEAGETARALTEVNTLLRRRGLQTADCLYALKVLSACDGARALDLAREIEKRPLDAYESRLLLDTLLPLNDGNIEPLLKNALADSPHDRRLWLARAALSYNAGNAEDALGLWRALIAVNPADELAALYIEALADGRTPARPIPLTAALAPDLAEAARKSVEARTADDVSLRWALLSGDQCAHTAVRTLQHRGDQSAVRLLRCALIEPAVPCALKLHVLDALERLSAPRPYLLVSRAALNADAADMRAEAPLNACIQRALRRLVPLAGEIDERLVPQLIRLWSNDVSRMPRREKALLGLGAAVLIDSARALNLPDPTPLVRRRLGLSERALVYHMSRLTKTDEEG